MPRYSTPRPLTTPYRCRDCRRVEYRHAGGGTVKRCTVCRGRLVKDGPVIPG